MNFYDDAITLIRHNRTNNPRVMQAKTPDGTIIVRVIVGLEEEAKDLVLFNPQPDQITHLEDLVAEARMQRALAAMADEHAWRIPSAPRA